MPYLIDTHSHFDDPVFINNGWQRLAHVNTALAVGVRHIVITGITEQTFQRILNTRQKINHANTGLLVHTALGLHPAFVDSHKIEHLERLEDCLKTHNIIALGEIGLDTYEPHSKQADVYQQQVHYFIAQLNLAVNYQLPVLLHIRKSHADALKILKNHAYNAHDLGGIAHSFSGGVQEAKAFVKMGFKLGITGQITNPNAKKLRTAIYTVIKEYGIDSVVIETDCPDMLPWICHTQSINDRDIKDYQSDIKQPLNATKQHTQPINTPANLIHIFQTLSDICQLPHEQLAEKLWHNSRIALRQTDNPSWVYPTS